jgi:hypothetical protein
MLKVMESLVNNKPLSTINPTECSKYRKEIAKELLQTDDFGKHLLRKREGNIASVLEGCQIRAHFRDLLTTMESAKAFVKRSLDERVGSSKIVELQKKIEQISSCESALKQKRRIWEKAD